MALPQARDTFQFFTRLSLQELTGLRATTIPQLLKYLKEVPGSVIYHHTHHFLQAHQYLTPEPPNDFAYWVTEVLGEKRFGEELASIDTVQFATIRALRDRLVQTVARSLRAQPLLRLRRAPLNEALYFMKSISVVLPTAIRATTLQEFADGLETVTIDSLYYHIFEARLRLERGQNDFSRWFETSLDEAPLARAVSGLDPYTYTMEELRQTMLRLVRQRVVALAGG